ncbi:hypothetical protein DCC62_19380 [candidate division KSB1 bacterium]|nr:MAG: hypothetical protein DCC62_19380 [candidate division KSB1 bacterium]
MLQFMKESPPPGRYLNKGTAAHKHNCSSKQLAGRYVQITSQNRGTLVTTKKNYTKIRLFIASPGDVTPERDRLLKVVQEFNQPNGFLDDLGVTLQALDWRSHVAPLMGRPEAVVLEQLPVESWDIFVGIMWSRFGTPTGGSTKLAGAGADPQTGFSFDSGTQEEFTLAYHAWQKTQRPQILFYHCIRDIPQRKLDIDQYQRLKEFLKEFSPEGKHPGFVQEFETSDDFASRVRLDLERLLLKLRPASAPPPASAVQTVAREPARQRYLETMIKTHQHLPVAGFETNLRIPIPLEKVYVTLKARMNELEHARGELDSSARKRDPVRHKTSASSVEPLTDQVRQRLTGTTQSDQTVSVQQALQFALQRDYDGLVLLGYPGAGKTTLTKYFLLCFAGNKAEQQLGMPQPFLPILLSLRDIDPELPLTANILASLQKYHLDLSEEFFLHYLQEGRAILLLDGLDEVPTEKKRAQVSQWIHHQAHLAFPKCPVIVTSRFSGYRGEAILPGYYLRLEIQDYGMPEVQQFLENWLIGVETHVHEDSDYWRQQAKSRAENLFQRIEAAPALRELAVNPLMLQIIALVHRDRGTLPERRVELYKECTDVLLERWDKAKGLEVLLSAAQARQLLQPIALWMHSVENRREVSKAELLEFMQPHLGRIKREVDPEELLQNWQERSGIFKGEGDIYFFHHLSFQEYLTAEEIRNTRQSEILVKQFDQAWWREPTLLAMGLTNPPIFADFMRVLLRANWRDGARVDFMLKCIDEALVKDEAPFVNALKRLKRYEARYYALLALKHIATKASISALMSITSDKNRRIAKEAYAILTQVANQYYEYKEILEMLEIELSEKVDVIFRHKTYELSPRIFNPVELNAEYILIKNGKYKYSVTKKEVEVPPLYFARYPVTNKLYNRFVSYLVGKGGEEAFANLPLGRFAESLRAKAKGIKGFTEYMGNDPKKWPETFKSKMDDKRFLGDDQPVLRVTWFDAAAYCHWLSELQGARGSSPELVDGKEQDEHIIYRLPTEQEWEWAAGGGKRKYPWGNEEPDENRANYEEKVGKTTQVGSYPVGATPEGLMDMAGNVWEWMENKYNTESQRRAVRGGSWFGKSEYLAFAARYHNLPVLQWYDLSFRVVCVYSFFDTLKL